MGKSEKVERMNKFMGSGNDSDDDDDDDEHDDDDGNNDENDDDDDKNNVKNDGENAENSDTIPSYWGGCRVWPSGTLRVRPISPDRTHRADRTDTVPQTVRTEWDRSDGLD